MKLGKIPIIEFLDLSKQRKNYFQLIDVCSNVFSYNQILKNHIFIKIHLYLISCLVYVFTFIAAFIVSLEF